jgi:glycine oxidase
MRESRPTVAVVGGGIIGCSVAYALARRGAIVHLFDMRDVAGGATQASAGMLVPHLEGHGGGPLLDLTTRSFALYDGFLDRVREDSGIAVAVSRPGSIQIATDPEAAANLAASAGALRARGIPAEFLDSIAIRADVPQLSATVTGGLLVPPHAFVQATSVCRAVAEAAAARGVRVRRATSVRHVTPVDGGVQIDTDEGPWHADVVVVAAGAWSGRIGGLPAAAPVRPVRGQLLQLASDGPSLRRIIWGEGCYIVPWPDGSLLVGATVEEAGFDEHATTAAVRDLLEAACDVLPSLWQAAFIAVKVGLRPASSDGLPLVGRSCVSPNVVYATGHYRNGVLLAPLTAALVADLVVDGTSDPALDVMSPGRFGL